MCQHEPHVLQAQALETPVVNTRCKYAADVEVRLIAAG
jgi:hypothetical protein